MEERRCKMKISVQRKSILIFINRKLMTYNHIIPFLFELKIMYVKIIKYASNNSQALEFMSGKSMKPEYVDYFINHDKLLLEKTLKKLLIENKKYR